MIYKQKFTLLLILGLAVLFNACEKNDDNEQLVIVPEVGFETGDIYFEDGDTVRFTNTSTDAENYRWKFETGNRVVFSEEDNPVLIMDIPVDQMRETYQVTLTGYSSTGDSASFSQDIYAGYRSLDYVNYQNIDHPAISDAQTDSVTFYCLMGPVSDPESYDMGNNRSFSAETVLRSEPQEVIFEVPNLGFLYYMFDELWFINLYMVNPEGDDYLIVDKTFNPTQGGEWSDDYNSGLLKLTFDEAQVEMGLRYTGKY
jgi:hypothetical protein